MNKGELGRRKLLRACGASLALSACARGTEAERDLPEGAPNDASPPPRLPDATRVDDASFADADNTDADADGPLLDPFLQIDTFVVVMMENRSFDHYLGRLRADPSYAARDLVEGLTGQESNPREGGGRVSPFRQHDFTVSDPPHSWEFAHQSWNQGQNDGFVRAHAGPNEADVMGYHERDQLPFLYWLADEFVVCDSWFSSVLGPTWPNRYYLHAGTSMGRTNNSLALPSPPTLWDAMRAQGKSYKNYYAGVVPWYLGGFFPVLSSHNPLAPIGTFFQDAKAGTLPNFSLIDPDFSLNDDHPDHDIRLGQAFLSSIVHALFESPQYSRTLLVITYDENGGFFDHVAPPPAVDDRSDFRQLGFRVPALLVGPTVKRGVVDKTVYEHTSVGKTLSQKFGFAPLTQRMATANGIAAALDRTLTAPRTAPRGAPVPNLRSDELASLREIPSQKELLGFLDRAPSGAVNRMSLSERLGAWLRPAEELGAVRMLRKA